MDFSPTGALGDGLRGPPQALATRRARSAALAGFIATPLTAEIFLAAYERLRSSSGWFATETTGNDQLTNLEDE